MKKTAVFLIACAVACISFGGIEGAAAKFDPITTNLTTQVLSFSGEVMQIGVESGSTNAFDLTISDYFSGTTIYSATNITSTSFSLVPRVAATDTAGNTATNTLGTIYVPAYVKLISVTAGNSTTTNDTATVKMVINKSP